MIKIYEQIPENGIEALKSPCFYNHMNFQAQNQ